jgi:RNA polymerase sigma-70 factor (ECF subfamily)
VALGSYERLGDARLLALHRAGNVDAFGEIFRRHAPSIRRYVRSLSDLDAQQVDDIVQDTFVSVMRKTKKIDGAGGLHSFLYRAAKWSTLTALADAGRWKRQKLSFYRAVPTDDLGADEADPLNYFDSADARASLVQAVGCLSEHQRQIFLRFELRGDSLKEIAADLGLTRTAVASSLCVARNRVTWVVATGNVAMSSVHGTKRTERAYA